MGTNVIKMMISVSAAHSTMVSQHMEVHGTLEVSEWRIVRERVKTVEMACEPAVPKFVNSFHSLIRSKATPTQLVAFANG